MSARPGSWTILLGRLFSLILVIWGVSLVTFSLQYLAPGDPAEVILRQRHEATDPGQVAALRRQLGLDDPAHRQYLTWLGRALRLDLGRSRLTGEPVAEVIARRIPATLELALAAFLLMVALSTLAGLAAAPRCGRWWDRLLEPVSLALISLPSYWLALLLIALFSLRLGWLPAAGRDGIACLALPVLTLGLGQAAMQGRVLRAGVLDAMRQDFVRFCLAKGLAPSRVILRHVLPNSLLPMVTLWGMALGHLLGGVVVVESIFAWPGLGRALMEALLARDMPVVQGVVMFMATAYVLVSHLADALRGLLDPRLRPAGGGHD